MFGHPASRLDAIMQERIEQRRAFLLLLSLVLVILMHPILDQGMFRRVILGFLTFVPLVLTTIKIYEKKWVWPFVFLISGSVICAIAGAILSSGTLMALQWTLMTLAFGLSIIDLFSYLQQARTVTTEHLYTAASIYLLIGISWFALYSAIENIYPGSFLQTAAGSTNRPSDLLYFSLVTLTTLGYGDILPASGEVRMLAALEAITGVLYVAITVALLVSAYKQRLQE
jgi:Ion channel